MNEGTRQLKISIVGDGTSGKFSLLESFSRNVFPDEYIPTVHETATKTVAVDELQWSLSMVATAGQEEYHRLRAMSYGRTDCFLLCFAIDSHPSFANVENKWLPELRHHCPTAPIVLVATKSDLRSENSLNCIPLSSAKKLKERIRARALVECSAKTQENLDQVFIEAVRATYQLKGQNKTCNIL